MMDLISWRVLRRGGGAVLARQADLRVEGLEYLPRHGPVLIAARHYHHLLDGCALVHAIDRPLHIVVGLDWVQGRLQRRAMDALCRAARWPVVLRPAHPGRSSSGHPANHDRERRAALRTSARDVTALLREGRIVVVFPEGYPNIDPTFTPKVGDAYLPFEPGFVRYARIAERSGAGPVSIVPAGFAYERSGGADRWRITLRFGPAIPPTHGDTATVRAVEQAVRELGQPLVDPWGRIS